MTHDLNLSCIAKGHERYIILWPDNRRAECLRTLERWASQPDLSLTFEDVDRELARIEPLPERSMLPAVCVGAVSGAMLGLAITVAAVFAAWGMV